MESIPAHAVVPEPLSRAWYGASIQDFLATDPDTIVGRLARNSDFTVLPAQTDAWLEQIRLLKRHLVGLTGSLFLEFSVPRMGRRIDAVLLIDAIIFVVEFKIGDPGFDPAAVDQVWDYALDLKNFHKASHSASIVPILIATGAAAAPVPKLVADEDQVYRPVSIDAGNLRTVIDLALQVVKAGPLDEQHWPSAPYQPTPTIIEAARALYAQHSVEAIARYDAGAQNLHITSRRIEELADQARAAKRKSICFVTGVPGAGKTLVGLNIATQRRDSDQPTHAVFLSGNGPLVAVLREALTRDEVARQKQRDVRVRKGKIGESVKAFIQNVHHFRDDLLVDSGPPAEHVAIFLVPKLRLGTHSWKLCFLSTGRAHRPFSCGMPGLGLGKSVRGSRCRKRSFQECVPKRSLGTRGRAWNLRKTADFMRRRKKRLGFSESEPEFLISCMDRHTGWAVIVCLVGGGQEIHDGEAGIDAWIEALNAKFPHWQVHISSRLTDSEYGAGRALEIARQRPHTQFDDSLHLAVSMRSFRAESVSYFVKALLDREKAAARQAFEQLAGRYPLTLSRDLHRAKEWVRRHARGTERYGLVASSKAHRLKPDAIDIRVEVDPVHWFLNDKDDTWTKPPSPPTPLPPPG